MEDFFTWIGNSALEWVKKVLSGLGMGILTFTGVDTAFNTARDSLVAKWGDMPASVAQILELAGFNTFFGIVLGAMAFSLSIMVLKRWGFISS